MVKPGSPCPLCTDRKVSADVLHATVLPAFSGDEAPLRLGVRGMPALQCAQRHTYFARPDFALWLMEHLLQEAAAKLPAGEARGVLFKHHSCRDCGKALAPREDPRKAFELPVTYPELPPFTVEVSMPMFRCTGCGKEQMRSAAELGKLVPAALVHAFKAAGLKAPG